MRKRYNQETKVWEKIDCVPDSNKGLNGPVWFPKGGTKYFDKALNKWFYSKEEKKSFMRENGLMMESGNEKKHKGPEAGLGRVKYFYGKN